MPREVLEYLETNTELAKSAIKSHKNDFSNNLKYIFIGFLFSIVGTITIELMSKSETELMNTQLTVIKNSYNNLNIENQRLHSEIESLKIELKNLKQK
jgi:hypothetical protein